MIDSSLNGQRVCEELSLLISLYRTPAKLVIGGQETDRSDGNKQQTGKNLSLQVDLKMG